MTERPAPRVRVVSGTAATANADGTVTIMTASGPIIASNAPAALIIDDQAWTIAGAAGGTGPGTGGVPGPGPVPPTAGTGPITVGVSNARVGDVLVVLANITSGSTLAQDVTDSAGNVWHLILTVPVGQFQGTAWQCTTSSGSALNAALTIATSGTVVEWQTISLGGVYIDEATGSGQDAGSRSTFTIPASLPAPQWLGLVVNAGPLLPSALGGFTTQALLRLQIATANAVVLWAGPGAHTGTYTWPQAVTCAWAVSGRTP